jgi:hypothetical protein
MTRRGKGMVGSPHHPKDEQMMLYRMGEKGEEVISVIKFLRNIKI